MKSIEPAKLTRLPSEDKKELSELPGLPSELREHLERPGRKAKNAKVVDGEPETNARNDFRPTKP